MSNRNDKKKLEELKKRYLEKLERAKKVGVKQSLETKEEKEKRIKELKKSFQNCTQYYFAHYCIDSDGNKVETPDFHIDFANKVKKKKTIKAIMRWARGHAKSVVADIFLPFWLYINGETKYMVLIGNNHDKSKILLSDLQAELEGNALIINDFGEQKKRGSWEIGDFTTLKGFTCKAIGMGQDVRGLRVGANRPDLIIADDLEDKDTIKNPRIQDEVVHWILTAVLKTMDGSRRRFVFAGNRFAPRMIQTELEAKTKGWLIHQINGYNPTTYEPRWKEKYTAEYWKEIEEDGVLEAHAEYNNDPHIKGTIFKDEDFIYAKIPKLKEFEAIIGFWDVAWTDNKTSDFNAIPIVGLKNERYYLIDVFCRQVKIKQALEFIAEKEKTLPKDVIIHWCFEQQFINDEILRTIKEVSEEQKVDLKIKKVKISGKKYDRIVTTLTPIFQNGNLIINEDLKAHSHTQIGLNQLKGIEPGYKIKDDFPDALASAKNNLTTTCRKRIKPRTGKARKRNR